MARKAKSAEPADDQPAKHPGGRPSKFKPEFIVQAAKLAALGATDREVAGFFEVNEATLNRWKQTNEGFCASLKLGKESADARVVQSLYRRAVGYDHDDIHFSAYAGEVTQTPYVKHIPPDTTAAIFWLKNRDPANWRDVSKHELTDADGKNPFAPLMEMIAANGRPRPGG